MAVSPVRRQRALALLLALALAPIATGDEAPGRLTRTAAWQRFAALEGGRWTIAWGRLDPVPSSVRGAGAAPLPGWERDPRGAVSDLFARHAELFGLRPAVDAFVAGEVRDVRGVRHLRMTQTFRGVPVIGGEYLASVAPGGRLRMLAGRAIPGVSAPVVPALGGGEARVRALAAARDAGAGADADGQGARLAILPDPAGDHLVYDVTVRARRGAAAWEVFVDARDGRVRALRDLAFHASGCARIRRDLPTDTLRDEDFEIAAPPPGTPATLVGPVAVVHTREGPDVTSTDTLASGCYDFRYDPDSQGPQFRQANVYWLVDHFLREFQMGVNGFAGLPGPVQVTIDPDIIGGECGASTASAFQITASCAGYSDLVFHETQHAINSWFGLSGIHDDANGLYPRAFQEGLANYFACAANDDPVWGEGVFGPYGTLNCNSDPAVYNMARIPEIEASCDAAPSYCVGMIWSGALWDLRTAIGPVADQLALEGLAYVPSAPTFQQMADAVVSADVDHHAGAHVSTIQATFAARGMGGSGGVGVPLASIAGPEEVPAGTVGTWSAVVCCGTPPYRYGWTKVTFVDGVPHAERIGTDASVSVAVDSGRFHLVLRVDDGAQKFAETSMLVTAMVPPPPSPSPSPSPSPAPDTLRVAIAGDSLAQPGVPALWVAMVQGGSLADLQFRWTRTYRSAGSVPEVVGTRAELGLADNPRSFLLAVEVRSGARIAHAEWTVTVAGSPRAGIRGPDRLALGEPGTWTAWAEDGIPPYGFRWYRDRIDGTTSLGSGPTLTLTGNGRPFALVLEVASANGAESDPATFHVDSVGVSERLQSFDLRVTGNPAAGGAWRVLYALPDAGPATLEVLDVRGRRLRSESVGASGPGVHALTLSGAPAGGVYLVRLTHAGRGITRKVVTLR